MKLCDGARVLVTEIDLVCAPRKPWRVMQVVPLSMHCPLAIFMSPPTGNIDIIRLEHLKKMTDAIVRQHRSLSTSDPG